MPKSTPTPTRGVPVELDKTRRLRYSLATLREIREEFGAEALQDGGINDDAVGKFLWYGLRHEDPDLTVEQVEDMVDLQNLNDIMLAVAEATGNDPNQKTEKEAASGEGNPPQEEQSEPKTS